MLTCGYEIVANAAVRTMVMATHTGQDLDMALEAFARAGKTLNLI